ncbi:MAG: DUF1311 domain-containing protein [Hyphomonadaceae bacterium]|nr:DUF1311 domain-containing protein [Hyphomonadaceae bacterium]
MRSLILLIASLFVAACATPVGAQEDVSPAASSLEACLAAAFAEERELATCMGVISGPCIDEPGGETTVGTRECLATERAQWQALVDEYVRRLKADATPNALAALEAYVAAHDEWRDARCAYARTLYEGGSLAQVVSAACLRNATAEFAIDLFERVNENLLR